MSPSVLAPKEGHDNDDTAHSVIVEDERNILCGLMCGFQPVGDDELSSTIVRPRATRQTWGIRLSRKPRGIRLIDGRVGGGFQTFPTAHLLGLFSARVA
jgi:hypothetical protein